MTTTGRRTGRLLLEMFLGLIVGLGILLGVAIYFLSTGPVSIASINPRLEAAINQEDSPVRFKITDTRLVWAGWDRAVDVIALGVTVSDANETTLAFLPEVSLGISARALLSGKIELSTVEVLRPSVAVSLEPGGTIAMAVQELGEEVAEEVAEEAAEEAAEREADPTRPSTNAISMAMPSEDQLIPAEILEAFSNDFAGIPVLETLQRFHIQDADVRLQDSLAEETIWLHSTNFTLRRTSRGASAFLTTTMEDSAGSEIEIRARAIANREADTFTTVLNAVQIDPDMIGRKFPILAPYLPALPFDGEVTGTFGLDGVLQSVLLDATSVIGRLSAEALPDGAFPAALVNLSFEDFDTAEWLSGVDVLADFAGYLPRESANGTFALTVNEDGALSAAQADIETNVGQLNVLALQDPETSAFTVSGSVTDLRLDQAATTAPLLDSLMNVTTPITATVEGIIAEDGTPLSGDATVILGEGRLALEGLNDDFPVVNGGSATVSVAGPQAPVVLEEFQLTFPDGLALNASAELTRPGATPEQPGRLIAEAGLTDLSFADLSSYWPPLVGPKPRTWILENMPAASVNSANIAVELSLLDDSYQAIEIVDLGGSIQFEDAEVHYLRPLTPAVGVSGEAQFTQDRFDIAIETGTVEDASIITGDVSITGLIAEDEQLDVAITVESPLKTAFALLDTEPRRYISQLGMDPTAIDGSARADVVFQLPLLLALKAEQVYYAAEATLFDVELPQPQFDIIVTSNEVNLSLVPGSLTVEGPMVLGDVPAQVRWKENFDGVTEPAKAFEIETTAEVAKLATFGLDVTEYAAGPATIDLQYSERRDGVESFALSGDLTQTALQIKDLDWRKPSGLDSAITLSAAFLPDQTVRIDSVLLEGAEHRVDATAELGDGGTDFRRATIRELQLGLSTLNGTVVKNGDWYVADLQGAQLDLAPFIADDEEDAPAVETDTPKISITGVFDSLSDGPDRAVTNTKLRADVEGDTITVLTLTGTLGEDKALDVQYVPTESGGHVLSVEAEDTGIALRVADITGRLDGGTLSVKGSRETAGEPLFGTVTLTDFTVAEAPRLTKILQALSVTGLLSALGTEGLAFDSLTAEFGITDDAVEIQEASMVSSSIGIALAGDVNRQNDTMELRGDIAIKDILTRTIGQLPVLDFLLGEGLIGAAFSLEGPIEEPDVSVNPLSVLAPGFLRKVFSADFEGDETSPTSDGGDENGGQ